MSTSGGVGGRGTRVPLLPDSSWAPASAVESANACRRPDGAPLRARLRDLRGRPLLLFLAIERRRLLGRRVEAVVVGVGGDRHLGALGPLDTLRPHAFALRDRLPRSPSRRLAA